MIGKYFEIIFSHRVCKVLTFSSNICCCEQTSNNPKNTLKKTHTPATRPVQNDVWYYWEGEQALLSDQASKARLLDALTIITSY